MQMPYKFRLAYAIYSVYRSKDMWILLKPIENGDCMVIEISQFWLEYFDLFHTPYNPSVDLALSTYMSVCVGQPLNVSIQVYLWVVNEEEHFREAFELGVTGVMTDYPKRLRKFLEANPKYRTEC